jgi:hypothetical protein
MLHLIRRIRERLALWRWYLVEYRPIAGAEDPPSDPPTPADPPTPTDPPPGGNPEPTPNPDEKPAPESTPDPEPEPDEVKVPKGELERLRRKVAQAEKAERDRKRAEAEAAGKHEEVVKQVEQERDERDARIEELQAQLAKRDHDSIVRKVAGTLNFHDPEDALLRVPAEVAEKGEAAVTKHLRDVLSKSPHLAGTGAPRSGAPLNGGGGGEPGADLTLEQIEAMPREEMVKRYDEVTAALARLQQ